MTDARFLVLIDICEINTQVITFQVIAALCVYAAKTMNVCHLSDGSDVLYNKFNHPPHPNSNYSCVVAAADRWIVSRCDNEHLVTCQSNYLVPGNSSKI